MRSVSAVLLAAALIHSASARWVKPRHAIQTASGWVVHGVTNSVNSPRTLLFDSAGRLLVLQQGVGILALTLNSDGSVKSTTIVRQDSNFNHGLALSPDGKKLYASSSDAVWSWDYDASANRLSNQQTLVTGMDQDGHSSRTILVSTKHPELLYVSRGSSGNIDTVAADPGSGRSTIKAYNLTSVPDGGYDQASQGEMVAYGARNEVGIVEDASGVLWGVENSADDVVRVLNGVSTDVHQNNPGEKLHSFGDVTAISAAAIETKNYGYPYCLSVWDPSAFPTGDSHEVGDFFVQESSGNITDAICDTAVKPKLLFPAHTAPLDIKFSPDDGNDAYVAFHGSWNREPPIGYSVSIVPGRRGSGGAWSPSADLKSKTGFNDILTAPDLTACPSNCFRPTALVWSPSGDRLYVASDTSDEIVLLQRGSASDASDAAGRRAQVPFAQFFRRLFGEL